MSFVRTFEGKSYIYIYIYVRVRNIRATKVFNIRT